MPSITCERLTLSTCLGARRNLGQKRRSGQEGQLFHVRVLQTKRSKIKNRRADSNRYPALSLRQRTIASVYRYLLPLSLRKHRCRHLDLPFLREGVASLPRVW